MLMKHFASGILTNLQHSISQSTKCSLFESIKINFIFHPTPKLFYSCLKSIENNNSRTHWYKATSLFNLKQRNQIQTQARTPTLFYIQQCSCAHYPNNCCRVLFYIEKLFVFNPSCPILNAHTNMLYKNTEISFNLKNSNIPTRFFAKFSYVTLVS